MLELVADGDDLALAEQEVVDGLLDLEDVDIDQQVWKLGADVGDGARHHDVGDAGHRADLQFQVGAALQALDDELQVLDLVVDAVDLAEDVAGLARRRVAPALAAEELQAEQRLGMLHDAADAGRGDVEKARGAADAAGDHDGADDFDLPEGEHAEVRSRACRLAG